MHYLREILERGNIDPDRTIVGGLIDLGGFATLVHNYELDRTVILKAVLDLSGEQGVEDLPLNVGLSVDEPDFVELPIRYLVGDSEEYRDYVIVQEVGLEVNIRWSELEKSSYVSRFAIEMDGEPLAAIVSPPSEGRAQLTDFNFKHPLLRQAIFPNDYVTEEEAEEMGLNLNKEFGIEEDYVTEEEAEEMGLNLNKELGIEEDYSYVIFNAIWELSREVAADRSALNTPDSQLRIAVATETGALPKLDHDLVLEIRDPDVKNADLEEHTPRVNGLRALLSEIVLGPARLVRDHLMQMTYIGPLRDIPTRNFRPQVTPDEARWAHGLAAWDLLYNDRCGDLMDKVNVWLSGEEQLRTMYRLERVEFKEIQVPSAMHQMFERGVNEDDIGKLQELYLSLGTRTEIALHDLEKDILVSPGDVGVGISQMIPVIVAALRNQDGVLGIEQPEIHVHPAIQVGMGDLFINGAAADQDNLTFGKTFIIETHSEHILLRLLRRMREQTEDELPPGALGLTPDDLSVIYVEASVEGICFRPLRVSPDGDFVDRWPNGFFAERAEELF